MYSSTVKGKPGRFAAKEKGNEKSFLNMSDT
jgi:hypothetical protein